MKKTFKITALPLLLLLTITGCGKATDIDKIADAQSCLDSALPAEADACVEKVEGLDSQGAYLIRCVGKFIKEGFNDPSKIATALAAKDAGGNGADGSLAMIAALAFKSEATSALNSASAQNAFNYCTTADSKGLIMLSGLTQTATVLGDLGGADLSNLSGTDLQNLMSDPTITGNPVAQAAVGNAVVAIYSSNCGTGQAATGNFCEQFDSAVTYVSGGTSNPTGIGQQIMACYANPAAAGCSGF